MLWSWVTSVFQPGLIFVCRLLFVEKGLPESAHTGAFVSGRVRYYHEHIEDRSLSSFTELIRLRRFGMDVARMLSTPRP